MIAPFPAVRPKGSATATTQPTKREPTFSLDRAPSRKKKAAPNIPAAFPAPTTPIKRPQYDELPDMVILRNEPLPVKSAKTSKYEAVFAKLKPGDCLAVVPSHIGATARALRKWIAKHKHPWDVVQRSNGKSDAAGRSGRVWVVKKEGKK